MSQKKTKKTSTLYFRIMIIVPMALNQLASMHVGGKSTVYGINVKLHAINNASL